MNQFVSVIIPVLNNIEGLCLTLSALDSQTYPKQLYEVIVVDNGSKEDLESVTARFKQVKLTCEERPGSYIARNRGIAVARGEIVAFTDSDCIPEPDWLINGVETLTSVENCGLVGGKINFFYQNPHQPTVIELYDSITFLNQKKYIEQLQYAATANLFTWKGVIDKVGNFKAALKSGGDKEWGKRVASYGYGLVYGENVCIAHPARHSWSEISQKITRTMTGGYQVEQLSARGKLVFYGQKLLAISWRLKPPTKSIRDKFELLEYSLSNTQKIQLIGVIFLIHYQGVWLDIKNVLSKS